MYTVGSDHLTVRDLLAAPAGVLHALAADGRALCREARPAYIWPALEWPALESSSLGSSALVPSALVPSGTREPGEPCPACLHVQRSAQLPADVPAYPSGPVPAQPVAPQSSTW